MISSPYFDYCFMTALLVFLISAVKDDKLFFTLDVLLLLAFIIYVVVNVGTASTKDILYVPIYGAYVITNIIVRFHRQEYNLPVDNNAKLLTMFMLAIIILEVI